MRNKSYSEMRAVKENSATFLRPRFILFNASHGEPEIFGFHHVAEAHGF